jgi:hypothetical protein
MAGIRVFIGYGYNARDKWVETHVVPLVKAFGNTVVHGPDGEHSRSTQRRYTKTVEKSRYSTI